MSEPEVGSKNFRFQFSANFPNRNRKSEVFTSDLRDPTSGSGTKQRTPGELASKLLEFLYKIFKQYTLVEHFEYHYMVHM